MTIMTETNVGACLQLGLTEQVTGPEPSLRLLQADVVGRGSAGAATDRAPAPEFGYYIVPGTGGHGRARADGLLAVIKSFTCRVGVSGYDATRRDKFLIMVAARPVLDALDLLLPTIARQMEGAARTAAKAYGQEVRSALPQMPDSKQCSVLKIPYFRNYLRGFGQGVAGTIRDIRTAIIRTEGPELARILAEQDARAEDVYNRKFPRTRGLKKERATHLDGFLNGQDAGRTADLGDEYLAQHDLVFAML